MPFDLRSTKVVSSFQPEKEGGGEINGGNISRSEIIELRLSHLVIVSFVDAENKETGMSGTDRVV